MIFCKDHFINSNKALTPLDGLCKCWPRASPASFPALPNPLVPSHRHTPHSPLTAGKFCLNFFCYLCYIQAKINLCICLVHARPKWIILENRDKQMEQHLWMKFSHIHRKGKKHWTRVVFVSSVFHIFLFNILFSPSPDFLPQPYSSHLEMLLHKNWLFSFLSNSW